MLKRIPTPFTQRMFGGRTVRKALPARVAVRWIPRSLPRPTPPVRQVEWVWKYGPTIGCSVMLGNCITGYSILTYAPADSFGGCVMEVLAVGVVSFCKGLMWWVGFPGLLLLKAAEIAMAPAIYGPFPASTYSPRFYAFAKTFVPFGATLLYPKS